MIGNWSATGLQLLGDRLSIENLVGNWLSMVVDGRRLSLVGDWLSLYSVTVALLKIFICIPCRNIAHLSRVYPVAILHTSDIIPCPIVVLQ